MNRSKTELDFPDELNQIKYNWRKYGAEADAGLEY